MLARSRTVLVVEGKKQTDSAAKARCSPICMRVWSNQWQKVEVADIWVCV